MKPRILFLGTPPFAVATLAALLDAGHHVCAVVTAPDRPAGRGLKPSMPAVKRFALSRGLPLLQPERLKDPGFLAQLTSLGPELGVVVAFRMLPEAVWRLPRLGTINLHASLLPDYRGAAPINHAIINGEKRTGITTFLLSHAIDTGDILLQEPMDIGPDETAGELHDRMMTAGAALMVRTVEGAARGALKPMPQDPALAVHTAPKLTAADARLAFHLPAVRVHDRVRGLSPWPGAWCHAYPGDGAPVLFKLLRTRRTGLPVDAPPGTWRTARGAVHIACGDEWIEALEVQPEGRRRMTAAEYVRGLRPGTTVRSE